MFKKITVLILIIALNFSNLPLGLVYFLNQKIKDANVVDSLYLAQNKKNVLDNFAIKKAQAAQAQYTSSSQNLITGTESNITSATAAAAGGTNLGSWRATQSNDNLHWTTTGTGAGVDTQLNVDGVELNGGNKMEIKAEVDVDAAIALKVQICDWVSSTSVDSAADAQCTGGGWRSINTQDASNADIGLTTIATPVSLRWHIYDGYFTTGTTGGTAISTPLSNFITTDANKRVKIRFYSTTASAVIDVDYLQVYAFVDSIYFPADFVNEVLGGTPSGTYVNASPVGNTTGAQVLGGDNVRITVPGTTYTASAFYFKYKNIKTYTGMNTILVRSEYSCANTGVNISARIWNYTTAAWETLNSTTIACSATDAAAAWAKNNITITDYISGGEMRVGWIASAASSTASPRVDYMYVMLGSTNVNSANCEIPIGTGTATNCTNTRTLDTLASATPWALTAEDESTNMGTGEANSYYAFDTDADATASEEAASGHILFSVTQDGNMHITGVHFAANYAGRSAGTTAVTALGLRDYGGYVAAATGGFTAIGATSSAATYTYTDSITAISATTYGLQYQPQAYVNNVNRAMHMRVRTSTDGASTDNNVINWDFAMVSLQWIETDQASRLNTFTPTSQNLVTGTDNNITSATAAANGGTNVGSWKGTIADDGFHWTTTGTGAGVDAQLNVAGVKLYGANKMEIHTEVDVDAAIALKVQICDWVSSTSVDSAADAQCTTGGWRSLNTQDATNADLGLTTVTNPASLRWQIYDGYFSTGSTGGSPVSTPLKNFINTSSGNTVKIRYYSTTASAVIDIDRLTINTYIDSLYYPAEFVNEGSGGTISGTYVNAVPVGNTTTVLVLGGDDVRLTVPGTSTAPSFYFKYKNVQTYTGMNSIVVRAEYGCANTGINISARIYNFNSSSWETLNSTTIACATADAASAWAKNNVTISNYISGGEMRVGWLGSASHASAFPRVDYMYVMLGTTNSDSSQCEIPIGTGTATNCTNTQTLDTLASASPWALTAEDESTNMGQGESNSYFPFDTDADATASEEAASGHLAFSVTQPSYSYITSIHHANNFAGRSAGTVAVVSLGLRDYSGYNSNASALGGFTPVGTTSNAATYTYTDSITALAATAYGWLYNANDHLNYKDNQMRMRIRTSTDGASTDNNVVNWDFTMVSLQWIDTRCYATITGDWTGGSAGWDKTSGCAINEPGLYDSVFINSGVTITMNTNSPVMNYLEVNGTLNTSDTDYTISSNAISVPVGGTLTANDSTINITGTSSDPFNVAGTFNENASTVDYSYAGAQTISASPSPYFNLKVSNTGTKTLGGSLTSSGVMTIASSTTLGLGSYTLTLSGTTGEPFVPVGTLSAGTGTVAYTGNYSGGNTKIAGVSYYNLTLNNSAETYYFSPLYRKTLTIDNTVVSQSDQTDFPLLIYLSSDADLAKYAQEDGDDIKFTDLSGNQLSHEIERYTSSTGQLVAWVKIPTLSASVDTSIYMYYGDDSLASQQNATAVWDTNFGGVWHLPDGTTLGALDSTSNDKDGTIYGSPNATSGKIGGAGVFDGGTDIIYTGQSNMIRTNGTISGWINLIGSAVEGGIFTTDLSTGGSATPYVRFHTQPTTPVLRLKVGSNNTAQTFTGQTSLTPGTWYHVAATISGSGASSSLNIYINGVSDGTTVSGSHDSIDVANKYGAIGGLDYLHSSSIPLYYANSKLDEIHVSNTVRSLDWIKTEYNNQNNPASYQTLGSHTPIATSTLNVINNLTITDGTLDTTTFNHNINASTIDIANSANAILRANNSLITLSGTGTVWSVGTNGSIVAGESTIKLTDTSSTGKTFAGGGETYNNFWFAPSAGTGNLTVSGNNTFNNFRDNGTSAHSILFTSGSTNTFQTFTVSGNPGQLITINSTDTNTHNLVKVGSADINTDYLNIQHSVATPSSTWYAGTHSTDNQSISSAGSGWIFGVRGTILGGGTGPAGGEGVADPQGQQGGGGQGGGGGAEGGGGGEGQGGGGQGGGGGDTGFFYNWLNPYSNLASVIENGFTFSKNSFSKYSPIILFAGILLF